MEDDTDRDAELRRIQEIALAHAVEEMDAAGDRGLDNREERGDRGFLTGMAAKSIGVAVKIEQFLILRNREGIPDPEGTASEAKATDQLIKGARAEVRGIIERVQQGSKSRA